LICKAETFTETTNKLNHHLTAQDNKGCESGRRGSGVFPVLSLTLSQKCSVGPSQGKERGKRGVG
jgi:hypothetical protein